MADYYPLLSRTVVSLNCKTAEERHVVYERARRALNEHLDSVDPPLSDLAVRTEQALLEAAIRRVERNTAGPAAPAQRPQPQPPPPVSPRVEPVPSAHAPAPQQPVRAPAPPLAARAPAARPQVRPAAAPAAPPRAVDPRDVATAVPPRSPRVDEGSPVDMAVDAVGDAADVEAILKPEKRRLSPMVFGAIGLGALVAVALAAYTLWPKSTRQASRPTTPVVTSRAVAPAGAPAARSDEAKSEAAAVEGGLPYVYRRQPVFYRTTNPVGTIIVDKSQRMLYLVQPNVSAMRYGIGVGRGCLDVAGLLRVTKKEEPADAPAKALGARVIYLGDGTQVIHGTESSKNIGGAVPQGCFLLVNDAVVDLYDRIAVGAGVVVTD